MQDAVAPPLSPGPARLAGRLEMLASLTVALAAVWLLAKLNAGLALFYRQADPASLPAVALPALLGLAFALVFRRVRYADFLPLLRLSLRSSAVGLLVYLVVEPPDFTLANPAAAGAFAYVRLGYFASLVVAGLCVVRPSFVVPVAVYVISTRHIVEAISGLPMSVLDIRYMVDMSLYLSISAIVLQQAAPRLGPYFSSPRRQEDIALAAFGLHLGNYFWSGIAKIALKPYPWTWILENPTHNGLVFSLENGTLPIGHWPGLVAVAYDAMRWTVVPLNAAIVGVQLFAILCVFRRAWLIAASILYDVLHVGIYVLGGLFFWPWIWNNFTILLAARKQDSVSTGAKAVCVAVVLAGCPWLPFHKSAWLGWYDVVDARQTYFEAVTPTERLRVPFSFFVSHSYSVSHGYMDTVPHAGQYGHTWWGSATTYQRLLSSGKCEDPPPVNPATLETRQQRDRRLARVARFIRAHHGKMKERQDLFGQGSYYLRLHHHPSNPWLFERFNRLDLRQVVGYNLVVESTCHRLRAGQVEKKVVGRIEEHFPVD